ncbi:hypothetical protein P153DRAFT_316327 [Dothidotthia symphoricarpi CBS 119687]|uniref:Zn(2)-C6 fungal-type domain-containing protein n=1 Tax=Dothidotthia symphoricarpi CBS 119687 TaxID=1392245 RepID=A0A6A6ACA2_9PLEO|nr:uncharacterized protein P153DRAFT_316327 [Dothidotthia symphoricarpi CBS 119687]KAF2129410.1 hypothetical protein P153DRAFT_316327 [Dothidotthia symphoricarpi CBS 119687]
MQSRRSCTPCRRRKMKCDRGMPCLRCAKSKNGTACVYEAMKNLGQLFDGEVAGNGSNHAASISSRASTPLELDFNSKELEEQLLGLANPDIKDPEEPLPRVTKKKTAPSARSVSAAKSSYINERLTTGLAGTFDVLQDSHVFGQAHRVNRSISHKNRVFGQSHWINTFTLFRDIIEMLEPHLRSGSSTMLGSLQRSKHLARVIKSRRSPAWPTHSTTELPPKHICDQLIEGYLRTIETVYRVLHIPTFLHEYEALCATQAEPNEAFLVQLKLVLAIGAVVYDDKFSMRTEATRWVYEAQTWMSSPVFKSRLGIQYLQTSILLLLARELVDIGGEFIWISAGSVLRTAMYIGLHRDPTQLPRISIFEAELRRRIWNTILEICLQSSLVSGGPSLITLSEYDTKPPGNFDDEQLTAANPVARTRDAHTQTSVAIALRGSLPARLAVLKFLNDIKSNGTYDETLRIDKELRASFKDLRYRLQTSATSTGSVPTRFGLQTVDFIMHRYITSLHLPFFGVSLEEAIYAFSRKVVVESSLKIWSIACPSPAPVASWNAVNSPVNNDQSNSEDDLPRLCKNGSGFFRAFTFQAATVLAVETRAQVQEDDSIGTTIIRPDLLAVVNSAPNWYLQSVEAGETGIKGYLLLRLLSAQIDALMRHVGKNEMPRVLVDAAEEAGARTSGMLARLAGQENEVGDLERMDLDINMSADFMEDWDLMMSSVFDTNDGSDFSTFSIYG